MIGVFDSGVGGLSVLTEIRRLMPEADLIYVADRARAPYGARQLDDVKEMSFEVAEWLVDRGATTVVVACNTASAAALNDLRQDIRAARFVGMEPAVKPAAGSTHSGVIGVFATQATFQGRLYESVIDRHSRTATVLEAACPQWVDLVEMGRLDGPEVETVVAAQVLPIVERGADILVLGCTHFSFLRPVIESVAGPGIEVVDPASAVAAQTERVAASDQGSGTLTLAASGDLDRFASLAKEVAGITAPQTPLPFPE